jgi:hypothetical protein
MLALAAVKSILGKASTARQSGLMRLSIAMPQPPGSSSLGS